MKASQRYEMMCLLDPGYEEEGYEKKEQRITQILENAGAEIEEVQKQGKRKLAYEVQDNQEGLYTLFKFTSDPKSIDAIADRANVEEGLIRYEIVNRDENYAAAEANSS